MVAVVGEAVGAARRSCRGSRPSRCSAGGCWCRAPRSRPARCPPGCARTAPSPRRCRPSRSSRRAPRSRWTGPSRAWSTGRYEWVALHLGQRGPGGAGEVRGVRPRRPRLRRPQGRRGRRADRRRAARPSASQPDLVPDAASSPRRACCEDWPPYDEVLDPINRVFLPRADIATETLVAGLHRAAAGRSTTSPPTARCGPRRRRPTIREAIKRGGFDAVRLHLVLDGAQPGRHRRQAARVDGDRRDRPADGEDRRGARPAGRRPGRRRRRSAALVEALAEFGAGAARWPALEAGEPASRPSERKGAARAGPARSDGRAPRCRAPSVRPRRLRAHAGAAPAGRRDPAAPGRAGAADVRQGGHRPSRAPIASMPGVVQHTRDSLRKAAAEAVERRASAG